MAATSVNCLAAVLRERGWSYTRLIAELRRHASVAPPKTESMVTLVSRWVNNHQQPDDFYRDLLSRATGRARAELFGDEPVPVTAARAVGRAIPELWPLGTEALALAMEVSVLEAKRLGHRAVLRLSWLLLVASVALSTLLQVAVAPPTMVGCLTAGATPVWLLGSLVLTRRAQAERAYADLSADGAPVSAGQLAAAAGLSASYAAPWSPSSTPDRRPPRAMVSWQPRRPSPGVDRARHGSTRQPDRRVS